MEPIIDAVPRELIERELTEDRLLRTTNNAGNMIYTLRASEAPDVMREIGRLRELAFRQAGGGTGRELDIDEEDLAEDGYEQLFVWDPVSREILGGYRYIICESEYPALIVENPASRYFFGKVTMYGNYNKEARNILMYFLHKYFPDRDRLLEPLYPVEMHIDREAMERCFTGGSYMEDYRILVKELRKLDEFIPPMINSYMSLSPSMKVFDTVTNPDFGDVEETGILINIQDIYPETMARHTKGLFCRLRNRIRNA